MFAKCKNNHLIARAFVVPLTIAASALACSQSHSMETNQFLEESPITTNQIEAAREPRRKLSQEPVLASNLKNIEHDSKESCFHDLFQTAFITKDGELEHLIYIDIFHKTPSWAEGKINLFKGINLSNITNKMYSGEFFYMNPYRDLCMLRYFTEKFSDNKNDMYCHILLVNTTDIQRRKGYAKFALNQLIEITFLMSPVSFINAMIPSENLASISCFKSLGFIEYDTKTISLDGGESFVYPTNNIGGGNHYLSRFIWEKRKS